LNLLTARTRAALLILITVAAFLPAIGAGYIWDDNTLLTDNPQIHGLHGLAQIWRGEQSRDYTPLTITMFWLEWRLWGDTPTGYHLLNILLHALSVLLLWRVLLRLRIRGAWLGALLFAIHPVVVASVAWVAELKNTLSAAFFFGSILAFLAGRDEKRRLLYAASVALFLLAALAKGSVVTLPAVLLLCILWKDRKVTPRDGCDLLPFALIALATALFTIVFQARAPHFGVLPDSPAYRLARAGMAVWYYLAALAWPAGLSPMRRPWLPDLHSPLAYLPVVAIVAAFALLCWKRRASWARPLLFAFAYYLILLLPVLGFVWMTLMQETPSADWWQYLAAPGIFACVASAVVSASDRSRLALPLFCVILALLLFQTFRRTAIYQSMETYCLAVTTEDPDAYTLQNNLGIMFKRAGHFPEAQACFRRALQANPAYTDVHVNMANAFGAAGDFRSAATELQHAGVMYAQQRQFSEAARSFDRALSLRPDDLQLRFQLCQALLALGQNNLALQVCADLEKLARRSGNSATISAVASLRHTCESPHP